MSTSFFDHPILNSPYEYPTRHWELDESGQPTQQIVERRRRAEFITPIPTLSSTNGATPAKTLNCTSSASSSVSPSNGLTATWFAKAEPIRRNSSTKCWPIWHATRSSPASTVSLSASDPSRSCLILKNHNLGLEVPYRYGSETRKYLPDFIVLVEDGHGDDDLLHLVVEIKGYRREDAKEKKATMETYWAPGVNNLGQYGRWAFAELTEVYQIEADFKAKVENGFNSMLGRSLLNPLPTSLRSGTK